MQIYVLQIYVLYKQRQSVTLLVHVDSPYFPFSLNSLKSIQSGPYRQLPFKFRRLLAIAIGMVLQTCVHLDLLEKLASQNHLNIFGVFFNHR
jgi:hypothetical protein